jgi:3-oxoacyl-[acyl-carrier-protein] synthase II
MEFGLKGPNYVTVSACASSTHAIGVALDHIRDGRTDAMVSGGAEAAVIPLGLSGFTAMKALSTNFNDTPEKASRPFDKLRDGFVMGEGAVMFILEEMESAKARGAKIYGELAGFGMSADAYHITAPAPQGEGAQIAIRMAVSDAGLELDDIDHINAHGTSTPYNDPTETEAIKIVFGERAKEIPTNSTKSMIGHLLGASGATEMAAALLCAEEGMIHPTINQEVPDPECDLDYVPNVAREYNWKAMLLNSFGFGGQNACLVVTR